MKDVKGACEIASTFPPRDVMVEKLQSKFTSEDLEQDMGVIESYNSYHLEKKKLGRVCSRLGYVATALMHRAIAESLSRGVVEQANLLKAFKYAKQSLYLFGFWHVKFREVNPDHPRPVVSMFEYKLADFAGLCAALGELEEMRKALVLARSVFEREYVVPEEKVSSIHHFMLAFLSSKADVDLSKYVQINDVDDIYRRVLIGPGSLSTEEIKQLIEKMVFRHTHQCDVGDDPNKEIRNLAYYYFPIEVLALMRLLNVSDQTISDIGILGIFAPFDRPVDLNEAVILDKTLGPLIERVREDWPDFQSVISGLCSC